MEVIKIDTGANLVSKDDVKQLPLYNYKSPYLKVPIAEYNDGFPNQVLNKIARDLEYTRKKLGGVGLAANQCGYNLRMFVIGTDTMSMLCINPKVLYYSDEIIKMQEGCLSFPGLFINIKRSSSILVSYLNELGEEIQKEFSGLTARCFMHELDHLNGVRMIDVAGPASLRIARKNQKKLLKKHFGKG